MPVLLFTITTLYSSRAGPVPTTYFKNYLLYIYLLSELVWYISAVYIALDAEPKSEEDIATWKDFENGARKLITKIVADACFSEAQCIWPFVEFLYSELNTAEDKFESNLADEDFVQDLLQKAGSCSQVSESSALVSILDSFKYFLGTDFCVGPTDVPLVLIILACCFHSWWLLLLL